ncbi:hypothetical protein ACFE33_08045 [Falsihalocynthiibacter sp. SS001]|uniref:hypothetical protein n=1 Tax=Falsihalocynthiibacter sp. SS001 TaxID=3349698 RepID=UPI0036D38F8B
MKIFPSIKPTAILVSGMLLVFITPVQADEETRCQSALNALTSLLVSDDNYHRLRSEDEGNSLHGVRCREQEITAWFEENEWTTLRSFDVEAVRNGAAPADVRMNRGLVFCRPQPFLLRWSKGGCSAQASVLLHDGVITQVYSGPTK